MHFYIYICIYIYIVWVCGQGVRIYISDTGIKLHLLCDSHCE